MAARNRACCERKMCGFVHMRRRLLGGKAVLGLEEYKDDDDDDKTVVISSHQGEFTEIRRDLRFVVYTAVLFSVLEQRLCISFCSAFSQRRVWF